jgi:hypothetical protein
MAGSSPAMTAEYVARLIACNHTVQSSFTIRVDAIFTTRIEAAFTKAFDVFMRVRTLACLCPARHAD